MRRPKPAAGTCGHRVDRRQDRVANRLVGNPRDGPDERCRPDVPSDEAIRREDLREFAPDLPFSEDDLQRTGVANDPVGVADVAANAEGSRRDEGQNAPRALPRFSGER